MSISPRVLIVTTWLLGAGHLAIVRAQEQGGGIQGIVLDSSHAVVADVVVDARSPSMQGVATVRSDANGVYRFPVLQPGIYELTASRAGFAPVKISDIDVALGAEFRIDINLVVAELTQAVDVTAAPPLIDVRQNAAIYTADRALIQLLPAAGRNFLDVLTMAAGVQAGKNGLSIDGSTGPENAYVVNGIATNDLITGQSAQPVRLDFIEEIQIKSSGYSAEYGAALGGVINVITRSGGDQFHGSAGTYFVDPNFRWNGAYRPETRFNPVDNRTPETFVSQTTAKTRSPDYEWFGDIGGPIQKQRLWFYLSSTSTYQPSERTVLFTLAPQDGPQTLTNYESSTRFGQTITAAITPRLRARVTGQIDRGVVRRSLPTPMEPDGYRTTANPATRFDLTGEDLPGRLMTVNVDYVADRRFVLNSRLGYMFSDQFDVEGSYEPVLSYSFRRSNVGLAGVPEDLQFPVGYTSTQLTNVGRMRTKRTQLSWDLNTTFYGSWKGPHAVKAGLNAGWASDDVLSGNTAPNLFLYWNASFTTPDNRVVRGPFGYYGVQQMGTFGAVHGQTFGLFVQDSWQPTSRLTINAGVRTDRQNIPSYNEYPGLTFGFGDKVAPRIGAAWDVKGDARWKVYGSYGRFFDTTRLRLARLLFGGEVLRWDYYSLDSANWPALSCPDVGPPDRSGCPGEYFGTDAGPALNDPGQMRVEPDMKATRTSEFALGLDHELGARTSAGVRYAHKSLDQIVETVGTSRIMGNLAGSTYKICNPGIGICEDASPIVPLPDGRAFPPVPKAWRDYDALELRLTRRLTNRLYVNGSYTWSYLRGNIHGLANEDLATVGSASSPNVGDAFDTLWKSYDARGHEVAGRLPHDRPHVFKLQSGYTFPWKTSAAINYVVQSGALETTSIAQFGRYTQVKNRGDLGRVDVFSQVDLRLQHDVRLFRHHLVNVSVDVWNLFDQKAVINLGDSPYRDQLMIPDAVYFAPGGFDLGAYVASVRAAAGDPQGLNTLRSDPFYGQPQGTAPYQGRRMIQFSTRYRF